jgi:hypothetical protein
LAVPQHVALNHLYCTAIKDGMMVLGSFRHFALQRIPSPNIPNRFHCTCEVFHARRQLFDIFMNLTWFLRFTLEQVSRKGSTRSSSQLYITATYSGCSSWTRPWLNGPCARKTPRFASIRLCTGEKKNPPFAPIADLFPLTAALFGAKVVCEQATAVWFWSSGFRCEAHILFKIQKKKEERKENQK